MFNLVKAIFSKKAIYLKNDMSNKITDQPDENWLDKLVNQWITQSTWEYNNLKINEGASDELINDAESKLGYVFPIDFVMFYKKINGFKDWDSIGEMFSIWPIENIVKEYLKSEDRNFIPFCDYLIDSHRIGYSKDEAGVFKDYNMQCIAKTFEETIKLILEDSKLLY